MRTHQRPAVLQEKHTATTRRRPQSAPAEPRSIGKHATLRPASGSGGRDGRNGRFHAFFLTRLRVFLRPGRARAGARALDSSVDLTGGASPTGTRQETSVPPRAAPPQIRSPPPGWRGSAWFANQVPCPCSKRPGAAGRRSRRSATARADVATTEPRFASVSHDAPHSAPPLQNPEQVSRTTARDRDIASTLKRQATPCLSNPHDELVQSLCEPLRTGLDGAETWEMARVRPRHR